MKTTAGNLPNDLHRLARAIKRAAHLQRRGELTAEQLTLLAHLRDDGPLRIGELAELLGISQSGATLACQRLERVGLLTRTRAHDDERVVSVALTEAGLQRVEAWEACQPEQLAPLLRELTTQEATELQRLVQKMLTAAGTRANGCAVLWSLLGCAESFV